MVFTHHKARILLSGEVSLNITPLDRHAKFPPNSEITTEDVDGLILKVLKTTSSNVHLVTLLESIARLPPKPKPAICTCGCTCKTPKVIPKAPAPFFASDDNDLPF